MLLYFITADSTGKKHLIISHLSLSLWFFSIVLCWDEAAEVRGDDKSHFVGDRLKPMANAAEASRADKRCLIPANIR